MAKTTPESYEDLVKKSPLDLKNPENVKTTIEYDIKTGTYIVRTQLGDMELGTPMTLTPEEYQDYSMQESLRAYFKAKNEEEFEKEANKKFNVTDMQFDLGPAEKIFGGRSACQDTRICGDNHGLEEQYDQESHFADPCQKPYLLQFR